jgi:hypothetical protein
MWLLVIVLLVAPAGISRVTVLNSFASYEECKPERDRIGFAMAESYPQENTFRIECALREQKPSLQPVRHERDDGHLFPLLSRIP